MDLGVYIRSLVQRPLNTSPEVTIQSNPESVKNSIVNQYRKMGEEQKYSPVMQDTPYAPAIQAAGMVFKNPANVKKMDEILSHIENLPGADQTRILQEYIVNKYPKLFDIPDRVTFNSKSGGPYSGEFLPNSGPTGSGQVDVYNTNKLPMSDVINTTIHELVHGWQHKKPLERGKQLSDIDVGNIVTEGKEDILSRLGVTAEELGKMIKNTVMHRFDINAPKEIGYFPSGPSNPSYKKLEDLYQPAASLYNDNAYSLYNKQPIEVNARQGGSTASKTFMDFLNKVNELRRNSP